MRKFLIAALFLALTISAFADYTGYVFVVEKKDGDIIVLNEMSVFDGEEYFSEFPDTYLSGPDEYDDIPFEELTLLTFYEDDLSDQYLDAEIVYADGDCGDAEIKTGSKSGEYTLVGSNEYEEYEFKFDELTSIFFNYGEDLSYFYDDYSDFYFDDDYYDDYDYYDDDYYYDDDDYDVYSSQYSYYDLSDSEKKEAVKFVSDYYAHFEVFLDKLEKAETADSVIEAIVSFSENISKVNEDYGEMASVYLAISDFDENALSGIYEQLDRIEDKSMVLSEKMQQYAADPEVLNALMNMMQSTGMDL